MPTKITHYNTYERHVTERRCTGGQPKLVCNGGKFKHIMNSSEKVFYGGNTQFSLKACKWIECHSERIGRHIHHALCGHGGERCVVINKKEIVLDGHDSETSTVYQFHGCKWYGYPCITGSTNDKYQKTLNQENQIRSLGYNVVSVWECENPEVSNRHLQKKFIPYPHHIVSDFETVLRRLNLGLTFDLKIDCSHIPVSVAINDSLTNEPIFIENRDPERLIEESLPVDKKSFRERFGIVIQC